MSFFERTRFRSKQQCNLVNNTTENLFNNTNENLFNNNYEKKQTTRPDVVLTENMMIDIKIDDQDNDLEMKQNNNDFDNALPPPPKLEGITQLPDLPIIPPLNFQVTNSKKKKPYKQKKTKKTTKKKTKIIFVQFVHFLFINISINTKNGHRNVHVRNYRSVFLKFQLHTLNKIMSLWFIFSI